MHGHTLGKPTEGSFQKERYGNKCADTMTPDSAATGQSSLISRQEQRFIGQISRFLNIPLKYYSFFFPNSPYV